MAALGVKAGVKVSDSGKCASAHDLRRSFARRWAAKVMPHVLMQLMRHAEISTTMKYYATRDAEAVADVLLADSVNNSVNIDQKTHDGDAAEVVASADNE